MAVVVRLMINQWAFLVVGSQFTVEKFPAESVDTAGCFLYIHHLPKKLTDLHKKNQRQEHEKKTSSLSLYLPENHIPMIR